MICWIKFQEAGERFKKKGTELDFGRCSKCGHDDWEIIESPHIIIGNLITIKCRKCGYTYPYTVIKEKK